MTKVQYELGFYGNVRYKHGIHGPHGQFWGNPNHGGQQENWSMVPATGLEGLQQIGENFNIFADVPKGAFSVLFPHPDFPLVRSEIPC